MEPTVETAVEQGTLRIMDIEAGDIEIKWSRYNEDEIDAAREAFKKAKKKGFVFYKGIGRNRDGGIETGAILTEFDEKAEIIVGRPMVQGG